MIQAIHRVFQYFIFSFFFMVFLFCNTGKAQTDSVVINQYARIISIQSSDTTDVDSVEVINTGIFATGDTVLFIVMKGSEIYTPADFPGFPGFWGTIYNINNTGIYNILLVNKVSGNYVIFTTTLRKLNPVKPGEVSQLIKIRGGQAVYEVNKPHTCEPWDPVKGTGGVFALIAGRKIVLNDVIDVTGKGFIGGDPKNPTPDYFEGSCSGAVDGFHIEAHVDSSGRKGEGVVYEGFPYTRGNFFSGSSGGGGNGKYSGGGGGGNYGTGGNGGKESESCSPVDNLGGSGKFISNYYSNSGLFKNRIFMGGGGGTSTQNPDNSRHATAGGGGGGIIILITDTIEAKGTNFIRTKGQDVADTATAGAGGGGGGGVIVLEANTYLGAITFNVEGGNGGWTNHPDATGPGGFGGGGVIWYAGDKNLPGNVIKKVLNGKPGQHITGGLRGAISSSVQIGTYINNLRIPLSGFLFNVMPEDQDVCEGINPVPFYASKPKGGTWSYTYKWLRSPDKITWSDAPEKNDSIYYVSGLLIDTTYFRRIVYSGSTIDTSLILTINILPILHNNNIAPDDTICKGSSIPDLKDDPFFNITGGNGTYTFLWESRTETTTWSSTGITDTILRYTKPLETSYYRRIVRSHVCRLVSNSVTITVLDNIHNNLISPDDTICENDDGQPITGQLLSGGDGKYTYFWQSRMNSSSWEYAKAPYDSSDYDPDTLITTRYYRRLIISGADDVCKDTSNVVTILVHPLISNNIVARDTIICADDPNLILTQQTGTVGGGDGLKYIFGWQSKSQGGSWDLAGKIDTLINFEPGYLTDTIMFRRFVTSRACSDISNEVEVIVQDSILNNLITDNDTICQGAIPSPITGQSVPTGGDGIFAYQWQKKLNSTVWGNIAGAILPGYAPPSLIDTTYYRRRVVSGKCSHISDFTTVIVQAPIANNVIKNGLTDETCYETSLFLDGTAGLTEISGGDETHYNYHWEKSVDNINWDPAPEVNNLKDYTTEDLLLPAYFSRNVESGACTNISASTYVSINPRPTGEFINDEYPVLCYDAEIGAVEIQIQYKLTGTPPYNLIYWNGFDDDTVENIVSPEGSIMSYFTTPDTTFYEIELTDLTDANGCIAYHDSLAGLVTAVLYRRPGALILEDEDTVQVCDDHAQLVSQQDVGFGYWTKVAGDENLNIYDSSGTTTLVSTIFNSKNSQYYKLYRTNINWPVNGGERCFARDSIEVIFWQEPDPAYAGSQPAEEYDTIIFFADHMHLYADPPTAGSGKWMLISGTAVIENDTLYNSFIDLGDKNLDETVEYLFNWSISNGICPVTSDDLSVSRRDLRIYEGFSPDGNGINDFYIIEGLDYTDTYDFKIFTRSGNLIKRIRKGSGEEGLPGDQLWDGTYDGGRPMETGIYYYTLEVQKGDRDTYQYRGQIVLTRENQ